MIVKQTQMSIFTKSFIQTSQKKNWRWIGGISGIVTIASFVQTAKELEWWQSLLVLAGSLIAIALLLYIFYFFRNAYGWIHNVRVESIWGEIVKVLADVYAYIHEIERKAELTDNDIAGVLSFFCNKVKELFDKKTNSNCCVSIKVPISHFSDSGEWQSIQVKNVSRDQSHISERDTPDYKDTNHDIVSNTAFSFIISMVIKESSKPRVYLDNDVQSNPNYITSSNRNEIPYKSELVVPIIPSRYKRLNDVFFGGFLCIDSDKKDSFDKDHYDIPMTVGLADGLYSIIHRLINIQQERIESK